MRLLDGNRIGICCLMIIIAQLQAEIKSPCNVTCCNDQQPTNAAVKGFSHEAVMSAGMASGTNVFQMMAGFSLGYFLNHVFYALIG